MTEMSATDAILALEDDLAAAVRTVRERTAAVLAIHYASDDPRGWSDCTCCAECVECCLKWPCPTARAVGVTE